MNIINHELNIDGRYKRIRDDWKLKFERKKRRQEKLKERKENEV